MTNNIAYSMGKLAAFDALGLSKFAGRMEKALRAGEIVADDLFPGAKTVPQDISGIREGLRSSSKAKNISRLRDIRIRGAKQHFKNVQAKDPLLHGGSVRTNEIRGKPMGGQVGTGQLSSGQGRYFLHANGRFDKPFMMPPIYQHELGEINTIKDNIARMQLPDTSFASHAGTSPNIRERLVAVGDPEVQNTLDLARQLDPEDKLVSDYMKQLGHTPDRPIPLGGKQHRSLDKKVKELRSRGQIEPLNDVMERNFGEGRYLSDDEWQKLIADEKNTLSSKLPKDMGGRISGKEVEPAVINPEFAQYERKKGLAPSDDMNEANQIRAQHPDARGYYDARAIRALENLLNRGRPFIKSKADLENAAAKAREMLSSRTKALEEV